MIEFNLVSSRNLGSMEIALAIALILFGALLVQVHSYYKGFSNDRLFIKVLVSAFAMILVKVR